MAGIILITLRILQGLALGGEYGGAATYVAEHSPERKRGFYTSLIQITATAGLFMSLGVILDSPAQTYARSRARVQRLGLAHPVPPLDRPVAVSLYIRISLKESPLFAGLKKTGGLSKNPIKESFGNPYNLKWVLLALFGATMGQGVVWYTGQFYALFYLQKVFHVALVPSNVIVGARAAAGDPVLRVLRLAVRPDRPQADHAGRHGLAVLTYYPIYGLMAAFAPATYAPAGRRRHRDRRAAIAANPAVPVTFQQFLFPYQGYNPWVLGICVFIQVIYVTMVYGPIAAFLVELFPTKIRYTSMSLPYHIGNGVFGGLVPIIGLTLLTSDRQQLRRSVVADGRRDRLLRHRYDLGA